MLPPTTSSTQSCGRFHVPFSCIPKVYPIIRAYPYNGRFGREGSECLWGIWGQWGWYIGLMLLRVWFQLPTDVPDKEPLSGCCMFNWQRCWCRPHLSPHVLPFTSVTHFYMGYYSFYRPRKDERLSQPSWLAYSRWFTHIRGHPSAVSRAYKRESSAAKTDIIPTVLCSQPTSAKDKLSDYWKKNLGELGRLISQLTPYGHTKSAEQWTIIHQYSDWYTGRWWVGCYIW